MKEKVEFVQSMDNLQNALRLFDYFNAMGGTAEAGQGLLDALRLLYKRVGQAGQALTVKLNAEFKAE